MNNNILREEAISRMSLIGFFFVVELDFGVLVIVERGKQEYKDHQQTWHVHHQVKGP